MRGVRETGVSMVEMLVALGILAAVSAAFAPALASLARLQRASSIETELAMAASAQLAHLAAQAGAVAGDGDARVNGIDLRWSVAPLAAPAGVRRITVTASYAGEAVVTLSEVVPDG